ncbi:unnamed protein product [Vitrella brassicaformis CCMP3155]|uniref:Uncharacterized protein n=1 Tax=Vitrella brassicaformis (strain CCMP3155) TaxID=1169540 RepID=A0A0G4EJJ3_VITBC|nr:unnamed protein product [Vitrella brassicaformis CCMP3155]|eukprot:CEL96699.1 unnamed protein product [Vitrella brassicaformis CCMP3155]
MRAVIVSNRGGRGFVSGRRSAVSALQMPSRVPCRSSPHTKASSTTKGDTQQPPYLLPSLGAPFGLRPAASVQTYCAPRECGQEVEVVGVAAAAASLVWIRSADQMLGLRLEYFTFEGKCAVKTSRRGRLSTALSRQGRWVWVSATQWVEDFPILSPDTMAVIGRVYQDLLFDAPRRVKAMQVVMGRHDHDLYGINTVRLIGYGLPTVTLISGITSIGEDQCLQV